MQMEELMATATAINENVATMKEEQHALSAKVEALADAQAKTDAKILGLQQKAETFEAPKAKVSKSLYDQFVESAQYKLADSNGFGTGFTVTLDTEIVKSTKGMPQAEQSFYALPSVLPTIQDVFRQVPTNSPSIEVVCEKVFTNSAAAVAEGAAFPQSGIETEKKTFQVTKIGHKVVVTNETLADAPALADLLNVRMPEAVAQAVGAQLANGDGTSNKLKGLFATGNYLAHGFKKADFPDADSTATVVDLIAKVIASMKMTGRNPSKILLNPMDYCNIGLLKDKQGRALYTGNPWGVEVFESADVPKGKFLVADPSGAVIRPRQQLEVNVFPQNGTDAEKDQVTIIASVRLAFVVQDPNCFVGGDLTVPKA